METVIGGTLIGAVLIAMVVISWAPGRSKPVDLGPAKPSTKPVQDLRGYDYLTEIGVINGTPGRLSDEAVRAGINKALYGDYTQQEKYDLLDNLTFAVYNNHADGAAADVLDEVSRAIDVVQGSGNWR